MVKGWNWSPPQLGHRRRSSPDYGAFLVRRTEPIEAGNAEPVVRGLTIDCEGVAHRFRANAREGKRVFAPNRSGPRAGGMSAFSSPRSRVAYRSLMRLGRTLFAQHRSGVDARS